MRQPRRGEFLHNRIAIRLGVRTLGKRRLKFRCCVFSKSAVVEAPDLASPASSLPPIFKPAVATFRFACFSCRFLGLSRHEGFLRLETRLESSVPRGKLAPSRRVPNGTAYTIHDNRASDDARSIAELRVDERREEAQERPEYALDEAVPISCDWRTREI
jgi:hypothetical protein